MFVEFLEKFNKEQIILLKDHISEILEIINKLERVRSNVRYAVAFYYVVKKYNIPISPNYILKIFNVKMTKISEVMRKFNLQVPIHKSNKKIEDYCKKLKIIKEFDEKHVIKICENILKKNKNVNELALVSAVLFKLRIFREKDIAKITGLTDATIRNYRRILNNIA